MAASGAEWPATSLAARFRFRPSRVVMGFMLAPLLPAFYATMFYAQPWAFPIGICFSYPAALLLGLPLYLLLRRLQWLGWWQLALCGVVCALPLMIVYWTVGTPAHFRPFDVANGLFVEAWGVFAGLVFWLIAVAGTRR